MAKGKYQEWLEQDNLIKLEAWARNGLTDEQLANNIGINVATLYTWKKKYSEINDALKRGKEVVDIEVENSLLKAAKGYFVDEEKTYISEVNGVVTKRKEITKKYIAPNTTAQIFWLKNRKPIEWRDKVFSENYNVDKVIIEGEDDLID
jgi:hypothetical protein